jgi:hypothetical protein
MSQVTREHLLAGIIFGDCAAGEYIYLPGGELGVEKPICIMERRQDRQDIPLEEAVRLITRLSLKPVRHPFLGQKAY